MLPKILALPKTARLYLVYSFFSSLYFAWPIFIAYISLRFGIAAVGLYFAVASISTLIFEIPTGYIADRFGRKASVILGILMKVIALILMVTGQNIIFLVLNGILYGLGLALISGALDALLYQSVAHKEYEETVSFSVTFYQIGLVLSAFLGGYLYEANIHLPFIGEAVVALILIIPTALMAKDTHRAKGEITFSEAFKSIKQIFTARVSLIFLAVYLTYSTVVSLFIEILLEKKMIELTLVPSQRGMVIAGIKVLAIFIVQMLVIKKLKSIRRKAMFALVSGVVSFVCIGMIQSIPLFIAIYLLLNPLTMLNGAILDPIVQKLSRHHTRATDISTYSLMSRLIFAIATPLTALYLTSHSTMGVYIVSAFALVIVTPFLLRTLNWYEES